MSKKDKVEVQKGPIRINEPTLKNSTYMERAVQDYHNDMMRKSMRTMEMMTPKQK